jgi:hypothetical protein
MTHAQQAAQMLRDQFAAAKVEPPEIIVTEDDYTGDGISGSVTVDDLTLHPFLISDGVIGWGVDQAIVIPGCHTLSNGDPGYPDDVDVRTIVEPFTVNKSLSGQYFVPNPLFVACAKIVSHVVDSRIVAAQVSGEDEYNTETVDHAANG